jgi:hypothetical protein
MKHRTAVKTGRTAALQVQQLRMREGSFSRYTAMVERLSAGYVRPLGVRAPAARRAP